MKRHAGLVTCWMENFRDENCAHACSVLANKSCTVYSTSFSLDVLLSSAIPFLKSTSQKKSIGLYEQ